MADSSNIIDPPHYKGLQPEPIDVIEAWQSTWPPSIRYHLATLVKYVSRCGLKHDSPRADLEKARWFLTRAIERLG